MDLKLQPAISHDFADFADSHDYNRSGAFRLLGAVMLTNVLAHRQLFLFTVKIVEPA